MLIKKILFLTSISIFLLMNCNDSITDSGISESGKGIYTLEYDENSGIYYSDFDRINFRKIAENPNYENMWLASDYPLLLAASKKQVSFFDTRTNMKIGEIIVPNTVNPEPNIWYGPVMLFDNKQSKDQCILVNRSVYMINLRTKKIEQLIWDVEQFNNITYLHDVSQTEDGRYLLLQLFFRDCWPIGQNLELCGWRQRLIKLDISNGNTQIIYNYPPEVSAGSKYVFTTNKRILSYDPNLDSMLIFDFSSATLLDSFHVSDSKTLWDEYPCGESVIIQSADNGNFFRIIPDEKKINPIITLNLENFRGDHVSYQQLKGGDLYACVVDPMGKKHSIVNLSNKSVVLQFEKSFTYFIIFKE